MNKLVFFAFIAIVFASCGGSEQQIKMWEKATPEEKWEVLQEGYMASGAGASEERLLPNVLSEREVLLKAADAAITEGVLDSSYYMYDEEPALMSAKIETPVLMTDADSGKPDMYLLTAVDESGIFLAEISVSSAVNTNDGEFQKGRAFGNAGVHYITKREAVELIHSQFSGRSISEPMAVNNLHLDSDPYSHMFLFWYFTVDEPVRSGPTVSDEYIIAMGIQGYASIPGGMTNRSAIDYPQHGDIHLKWIPNGETGQAPKTL